METRLSLQDQIRELANVDRQVRAMRSRLDVGLRRKQSQQRQLDALQSQLTPLQAQQKQHQAAAANLENEAGGLAEKLKNLRTQLETLTNNKQYSAMLVEVNTFKLEKEKLDEQALERMTQADAVQEQIEALKQRMAEQQKLVEAADAEIDAARKAAGDKLTELEKEREAAANEVPADVLARFERLAAEHEEEAVVPVEEQDRKRKEYNCGGCYIQLPPNRVNQLLTHPDELVTCSACGRILVMPDRLREELTK